MDIFTGFVFGIVFGSFLNVLIYRIPKNESVVYPSSHCPKCGNKLKFYHNVPILSWFFLKGRCGFCKEKISVEYPVVEFLSGIITASIVYKYSLSVHVIFVSLSFLMLLALSVIDLKYKMVPDSLNLLAICFAVLGAWNLEGLVENFKNALLFAGGFTLLRFALSYYLTSKEIRFFNKTKTSWNRHYDRVTLIEAMGEGDIMVASTMGALLGVKLTLAAVFLSALLALPVMIYVQNRSKEEQRVPFVPFLSLATFITFLFDSQIMSYIEANY